MNKKLLELLNQINEKKTVVQSLAEQGKLKEARETVPGTRQTWPGFRN